MEWRRVSIARLMGVVAVVALILGGALMAFRSASYRARAERHRRDVFAWRISARSWEGLALILKDDEERFRRGITSGPTGLNFNGFLPDRAGRKMKTYALRGGDSWDRRRAVAEEARAAAGQEAELAASHETLWRKYERAARRPWETLPADSPRP